MCKGLVMFHGYFIWVFSWVFIWVFYMCNVIWCINTYGPCISVDLVVNN